MSGLWSVVALVTWILLPGVATAAVVCREASPVAPVRVLTVGVASGLSVWFLGSEFLARLDLMTTTGAVVATAVVGVASLVVALGPGRPGLRTLRREPLLLELVVMLAASVVVALPLLIIIAGRTDTLNGPTPWYYLDLAWAVAHVHGVPASSPEWATHLPFLDDYPAFTSGTALLLAVGGTKSMVAAQAVRIVTLVAVGAGAYLFARAVGATRAAAAVSLIVLFASTTYVGKLVSYRPEATGYALVFIVGALAKLWLDQRRNVDLVLATVALLALSEVHGIGWLFAALVVGGLAVGSVLFSDERRVALRAGFLLVGVLVAGWLVGNLALGSGLSGASKLGGLPPSDRGDPTWKFVSLVAGRLVARPAPSATDAARRGISRGLAGLGAWWYFAVVVLVVALLLFVAWRGRGAIRRAAREYSVMALLVVAGCVAVSVWFALRWSTYVPTRTGWGRIVPLTFGLLPAGIALVISAVRNPRWRAGAVIIVLVLGVGVTVHGHAFYDQLDRQQPTPRDARGPSPARALPARPRPHERVLGGLRHRAGRTGCARRSRALLRAPPAGAREPPARAERGVLHRPDQEPAPARGQGHRLRARGDGAERARHAVAVPDRLRRARPGSRAAPGPDRARLPALRGLAVLVLTAAQRGHTFAWSTTTGPEPVPWKPGTCS